MSELQIFHNIVEGGEHSLRRIDVNVETELSFVNELFTRMIKYIQVRPEELELYLGMMFRALRDELTESDKMFIESAEDNPLVQKIIGIINAIAVFKEKIEKQLLTTQNRLLRANGENFQRNKESEKSKLIFENKQAECEKTIKKLKDQIDGYDKQIAKYEAQIREYEGIKKLHEKQNRTSVSSCLLGEIEKMRQKMDELQRINKDLQLHLLSASFDIYNLKTDQHMENEIFNNIVRKYQYEIRMLNEKIRFLESANSENKEQSEGYPMVHPTSEVQDQERSGFLAQIRELEIRVEILKKENENSKKQYEYRINQQTYAARTIYRDTVKWYNDNVAALNCAIDVQNIQRENELLKEKMKRLELETRKGYKDESGFDVKELKDDNARLERENEILVIMLKEKDVEEDKMKEKIGTLTADNERMQRKIEEFEPKLKFFNSLEMEYDGKNVQTIEQLRLENFKYKQEVSELRRNNQNVAKNNQVMSKELSSLRSCLESKVSKIKGCLKELEIRGTEIEVLSKGLNGIRKQNEELKKVEKQHDEEIEYLKLGHQIEIEEFKKRIPEIKLLSGGMNAMVIFDSPPMTQNDKYAEFREKMFQKIKELANMIEDKDRRIKELSEEYKGKLSLSSEDSKKFIEDAIESRNGIENRNKEIRRLNDEIEKLKNTISEYRTASAINYQMLNAFKGPKEIFMMNTPVGPLSMLKNFNHENADPKRTKLQISEVTVL